MCFGGGAKDAAREANRGLEKGRTAAYGQLDKGLAGATGQVAKAQDYYEPLAADYNKAGQSYFDALGLNGGEGVSRAQGAFQTGPGYDFAMDQGLQALNRTASSRGMLGSGNTSVDTMRFAQGLADQEWDDYLDRLMGLENKRTGVATAQAGLEAGLGDAMLGVGNSKAQIGWNTESGKGANNANATMAANQNIFNTITGGLSLGAKLLGL